MKTTLIEAEAQRAAMRYLHACDFLKHLQANKPYLSYTQMKMLKGMALAGDIDGAQRELGSILLGEAR